MTIEQAIVEWASSRPAWQRAVLRAVARGNPTDAAFMSALVDRMIAVDQGSEESFGIADMPARTALGPSVRLLEIRNVRNVNALAQDQPLSFAPKGLTIVYGDNASGKSGYARIIKHIVRARHQETILTDIFSDPGIANAQAEALIQVAEAPELIAWPGYQRSNASRIGFFDEACGELYLTSETEVIYRPASLYVLDGLIRACDLARTELERRLAANAAAAVRLPMLPEGTEAQRFLSTLSAETSEAQLQRVSSLPPEIDLDIQRLVAEEARLKATDPKREKERLTRLARDLRALDAHVSECERTLGDAATAALKKLRQDLAQREHAAKLASTQSFDTEPLRAVGSDTWRALWEAARQFIAHSCPELGFPPMGDAATCPLCQQKLDDDATRRVTRFEAFVRDRTVQDLTAASEAVQQAIGRIERFDPQDGRIVQMLEGLADSHTLLAQDHRKLLEAYGSRRHALLAAVRAAEWVVPTLTLSKLPAEFAAQPLAEQAERAASTIDDVTFATTLEHTTRSRLALEAAYGLNQARPAVRTEIARLVERHRLEQARDATNTQGISRKAAELIREHVTSLIRDRFTRESERLKLDRVTLMDVGGKKGMLQHQPAFVGALQEAPLRTVLSEGEQTALGLAGFFTEAYLDPSKSALVLDDPVSSLDHVRRGYVATRLAELAQDRQVIVFTHDTAFVADLRLAADAEGISVCERSIQRRASGQPGACITGHPWKTKDVKQRLQTLDQQLARVRRERASWDQDQYEREIADWGGRLSETWERLINLEIVAKIVDRGSQEVRPRMFKVLAKITEADDREFQASYARCSRWARRHDKSVELNYVAPDFSELENELALVRQWFERVRRYDD